MKQTHDLLEGSKPKMVTKGTLTVRLGCMYNVYLLMILNS